MWPKEFASSGAHFLSTAARTHNGRQQLSDSSLLHLREMSVCRKEEKACLKEQRKMELAGSGDWWWVMEPFLFWVTSLHSTLAGNLFSSHGYLACGWKVLYWETSSSCARVSVCHEPSQLALYRCPSAEWPKNRQVLQKYPFCQFYSYSFQTRVKLME